MITPHLEGANRDVKWSIRHHTFFNSIATFILYDLTIWNIPHFLQSHKVSLRILRGERWVTKILPCLTRNHGKHRHFECETFTSFHLKDETASWDFYINIIFPSPEGKKAMAINMQEFRFPEAFKKSTGARKSKQIPTFNMCFCSCPFTAFLSWTSIPAINDLQPTKNSKKTWHASKLQLLVSSNSPTFLPSPSAGTGGPCRLTCWHQHVRNIWIRLIYRQPKRGGG